MSFLIDIDEELDEQLQKKIRKFREKSACVGYSQWFRLQAATAKARDATIYHVDMDKYVESMLYDENTNPMEWYFWRDPQAAQVKMVKKNLDKASKHTHYRGRVTPFKLKCLMKSIVKQRIEEYLNPKDKMEKLKILCILGGSGCGKTLASLHLKYHKGANVICSYTTRPPRATEVEGRDHHFIDIIPDRSDILASTHFGGHLYYAAKWQVHGPCTVYVIDEKGLKNLKEDYSDEYEIYTVLIKRDAKLRRVAGVDYNRIYRDRNRVLNDEDFDYIIENNGKKRELFNSIESIYEEIKNK